MAVPSVVQIKKGEVVYTGKVDIAQYCIRELTRRAMIDVGRYVTYNVRKNLTSAFPYTNRKESRSRYGYWVLKKEGHLLLGIENKKHGAVTAWWADQLELDRFAPPGKAVKSWKKVTGGKDEEKADAALKKAKKRSASNSTSGLGSANVPRRHLLETFVKKHYDKIVEIESQYLEKINNEDAAVALARATEEMEVMPDDDN